MNWRASSPERETIMRAKYRDVISGAGLLLLGAALFITSAGIPKGAELGIGANFMPRLMSILLTLAGIALTVQGYVTGRKVPTTSREGKKGDMLSVILSLAYLGGFVLLLTRLGFLLSTFPYIFLQTELFAPREKRNHVLFALVSMIATGAIYLIFAKGFKLLLPAGMLG
jgi:putative tricarboxylic transport membrane protein